MSEFYLFFRSGVEHITDIINNCQNALFIISLFAAYNVKKWKKILILITAFTVGHCASLVFIFLHVITISTSKIDFFITAIILISAFMNLYQKSDKFRSGIYKMQYFMVILFGLFQATGFYNGLEIIAGEGKRPVIPFIAYNLGTEAGQVLLIIIILILSLLAVDFLKVRQREWILILSGIVIGSSLILMIEKFPW